MLVDAAGESAGTPPFAEKLVGLVSSLVFQLRGQSYIAGFKLLQSPELTAHEAIVVEATTLLRQASLSTDPVARKKCQETMREVVKAQPTDAVLAKLVRLVHSSRSSQQFLPALPTLAMGLLAYTAHADADKLANADLADAIVSLLIPRQGDAKETKKEAKNALVQMASRSRPAYQLVLGQPALSGHSREVIMLKKELKKLVGDPVETPARTPRTPGWRRMIPRLPSPSLS